MVIDRTLSLNKSMAEKGVKRMGVWVSDMADRRSRELDGYQCSGQEAICGCQVVIQTYVSLERQPFAY
ncbi:hypothetical protein N7522_009854 [Penicillium canescens]|uniref:Uncharacterized protein n=1 Tax=Penicillium canescens TaxID=5083 RepID=A0AAD6I1E4_PENCN|nr:uncharacterized protein N7446_004966 [Penicillium canescens]KAJ5998194.1 hypothetical protein N7522_009854 [Penicillium canescens]KAJ6026434.1 hypothetical protein N7460_011251 [Penicillium canescens]KAJ6039717.1 hypothetical protein N7444_008622 [Penicillium canescens]KAJ6067929.1 hypothetical protein N7446_004966 [Penicillium canescens]